MSVLLHWCYCLVCLRTVVRRRRVWWECQYSPVDHIPSEEDQCQAPVPGQHLTLLNTTYPGESLTSNEIGLYYKNEGKNSCNGLDCKNCTCQKILMFVSSRRVDMRYNNTVQHQPVRHSLSQAFHEKNGRKLDNGGYTMSEVTVQRNVKSLISRGIN